MEVETEVERRAGWASGHLSGGAAAWGDDSKTDSRSVFRLVGGQQWETRTQLYPLGRGCMRVVAWVGMYLMLGAGGMDACTCYLLLCGFAPTWRSRPREVNTCCSSACLLPMGVYDRSNMG